MKNVKLVKLVKSKVGKGWFLTIGDNRIKYRWAVTSLELWTLKKMIEDNKKVILEEMK